MPNGSYFPEMQVIHALDVDKDEFDARADAIDGKIHIAKVGITLDQSKRDAVEVCADRGFHVMYDGKFSDVPR